MTKFAPGSGIRRYGYEISVLDNGYGYEFYYIGFRYGYRYEIISDYPIGNWYCLVSVKDLD